MIIGLQGNPLIVQLQGVPAKSVTRNGGQVDQVVISLYPIRTIVIVSSPSCACTQHDLGLKWIFSCLSFIEKQLLLHEGPWPKQNQLVT